MHGKCVQSKQTKNTYCIISFFKQNLVLLNFRSFDIENHINVCPSNYRGRPVTESNIQDYISNIVSKYLPAGLPPWQICVIPIVRTIPLARSDEIAGPSTLAESTSGNETEEEQHQPPQPISSEQTTVKTK